MSSNPSPADSALYTPLSPDKPELDRPEPSNETVFLQQKYKFLFRIIAFIVLEASFTILAAFATAYPIALNLPSHISLTEAKGALTLISLVLHALAIICVKEIILCIFSAEWSIQYQKSGKLIPGETDIVSRMTAGLIDHGRHFIFSKATLRYRLAFISSMLLIAVDGLGPSSITINPVFVQHSRNISVANLTWIKDDAKPGMFRVPDRAALIARLEVLDNMTYGYYTRGNALIPWPTQDLLSAKGTIKYQSDVVTYNCSCSWRKPTDNEINEVQKWENEDFRLTRPGYRDSASIFPLWSDTGPIPFLVLGKTPTNPNDFVVDLAGFPTTNLLFNASDTDPKLASILLCDPQMQASPATVELSQGVLQAYPQPGPSVLNNLSKNIAAMMSGTSIFFVIVSSDAFLDTSVNSVARFLFLADSDSIDEQSTEPRTPLPLDQINERMNKAISSMAKGYLSGYVPGRYSNKYSSFEMISTSATVEEEALALVGSKPFLILFVSVLNLAILLLAVLLIMIDVDKLQTFDLKNVKILRTSGR